MKYYRIEFNTCYCGTGERHFMKVPKYVHQKEIDSVLEDCLQEYGEQWEHIALEGFDEDEDENISIDDVLEEYWENDVSYDLIEITKEEFETAKEDGEYIDEYLW